MECYSALIVDLKKSKLYDQSDRNDIQQYIKEIIETLNDVFHKVLKFDVVFSGGDEVQGLFYTPEAAYLYFRLLNMLLSPVKLKAGIGYGEWNIKIDDIPSTGQDGPVYHNARFAIDNVDETLGYNLLFYSGRENDIFINAAINAEALLINKQSNFQNEIFILTEIMFPIDANSSCDTGSFLEVRNLFFKKNTIDYYSNSKPLKKIGAYKKIIENIRLGYYSDALKDYATFYVSSGKIRGLATLLAEIIETSRQSVEKSIKSGNIFQARNAAIVTLKLMNKLTEVR